MMTTNSNSSTSAAIPDDHVRHSSNTFSDKRGRAVATEVTPLAIAWLAHTTLEMTSTHLAHSSRTAYLLHVHYFKGVDMLKPHHSWQVIRTFEDYVVFQKRLLKLLTFGHACSAECKWLHSFAKSYFPKSKLFGNCSTSVMNVRREKLIRYMDVLKSSLLNHGNHGCAIVISSLANEFTTFIEGHRRLAKQHHHYDLEQDEEEQKEYEYEHDDDDDDSDSDERVRRCSITSSISTDAGDDDEIDELVIIIGEIDIIAELGIVCDLCKCSLDGSTDTTDALPCNADGSICDTTTLSCSHQFHDACVLPLLEALKFCCPTCHEPQL